MKKNDFDKSVIKYMHEMSMPVLYKTKFWYKTRIDTPSLVSAAPQEDLIYWQVTENSHKTDYKAQTYTVSFFFLTVHPLLLF